MKQAYRRTVHHRWLFHNGISGMDSSFNDEARSSTLTCVASQSESMRRSPKGADVEVDGEQERHHYCTHRQRQQQLKQMPKRRPEPQKQHQQHAADAQAMKTWEREREKQTQLAVIARGREISLIETGILKKKIRWTWRDFGLCNDSKLQQKV